MATQFGNPLKKTKKIKKQKKLSLWGKIKRLWDIYHIHDHNI